MESLSRCLFALAVAIGIAHGQGFVALGIAAAPLVSLVVVPLALRGQDPPPASGEAAAGGGLTLRGGAGFAGAVLVIMAAEQALLNAPVVLVDATSTDAALAGFAFNVLLITRAPLQLFQAIQTTLLPHLSSLQTSDDEAEFRHALRVIIGAIAGFTGLVVLGLAAIGPWAMEVLFGGGFDYERVGLVLVGLGMGFHLTSGTLNQAALARGRSAWAAGAWLGAAALFLVWLALSPLSDELLAVEVGYAASTAALAAALWWIERSAPH
jgi:O-antigen/teichoic acid export membrane protein